MSWLYSRALVEEFSEDISWDGEPYAPLSTSPMPQAFSSPDKTTAASRLSRYGMTCEPLTASRGEELLTWFRVGFPVKTSALPERAQESTESDPASGPTWRGWSAKYDPATSMWRTAQCSLLEGSDESSVTWPRSGMTRDGMLWELPTLELSTSETDSGLWPTPVADDTGSRTAKYAQGGTALSLAVKLWPTPTVNGNYNRVGASATSGDGLATAVRMWPTPTLTKGGRLDEWGGSGARKALRALVSPEELTGPLNPTWVEWLMGWPSGWTDYAPLETAKFQEWQQQHSSP